MPIQEISSNNYLPKISPLNPNDLQHRVLPKDSLLQGKKRTSEDGCIMSIFKAIGRFFQWLFCCGGSSEKAGGPPPSLAEVFKETLNVLHQGYYINPNGKKVKFDLETMKQSTNLFNSLNNPSGRLRSSRLGNPICSVQNIDAVEAGVNLKEQGFNPVVINFANEDKPGGGVKSGATAQEEEICRKTGLFCSLDPEENEHLKQQMTGGKYKIPEFGCIYSNHVPVIREAENFEWKEEVTKLAFISSAAYHPGNKPKQSEIYLMSMTVKIKTQIKCAIMNHHNAIVLGAFGCGAFGNDPGFIAQLYKEQLEEYQGYFKHIFFAVYVATPADQQNLDAFQKVFLEQDPSNQ